MLFELLFLKCLRHEWDLYQKHALWQLMQAPDRPPQQQQLICEELKQIFKKPMSRYCELILARDLLGIFILPMLCPHRLVSKRRWRDLQVQAAQVLQRERVSWHQAACHCIVARRTCLVLMLNEQKTTKQQSSRSPLWPFQEAIMCQRQ